MAKTIYLLWTPERSLRSDPAPERSLRSDPAPERSLRSEPTSEVDDAWIEALRVRLTAVAVRPRVRRVQLNVADAAVSAAMLRLATFDTPVAAVVSVWQDDVAAPALDGMVEPLCARVAGYEVAESVPLDPPSTPPGERAEALANIALLRRPVDLQRDEWLRRWLHDHTPIAIAVQATFGYVQNVVLRPCTPDAPPIDGIVEELFPMAALSDPHAFYGSGGDPGELNRRLSAMTDSIERFGADRNIDVIPTSRYVF